MHLRKTVNFVKIKQIRCEIILIFYLLNVLQYEQISGKCLTFIKKSSMIIENQIKTSTMIDNCISYSM